MTIVVVITKRKAHERKTPFNRDPVERFFFFLNWGESEWKKCGEKRRDWSLGTGATEKKRGREREGGRGAEKQGERKGDWRWIRSTF